LDECLLTGPLADRTRILVTHALYVLDKTDYIYVTDNGVIIEEGTYQVVLVLITLSPALRAYPDADEGQRRLRESDGRVWPS
jgi:ATP-binding cassette, subfamily C (CFTR/MRP), member 1